MAAGQRQRRQPASGPGRLAALFATALLLAATACENVVARGAGDSDGVNDAEVGITF